MLDCHPPVPTRFKSRWFNQLVWRPGGLEAPTIVVEGKNQHMVFPRIPSNPQPCVDAWNKYCTSINKSSIGGFNIPVDKPEKYPWNYAVFYQLRGSSAAFLTSAPLFTPKKWDKWMISGITYCRGTKLTVGLPLDRAIPGSSREWSGMVQLGKWATAPQTNSLRELGSFYGRYITTVNIVNGCYSWVISYTPTYNF